jgi:hypothetical protein
VKGKFSSIEKRKIIVVKDEIEGWYLAGLDSNRATELGISVPPNTEHTGKDEFTSKLNNSKFNSSINFYQEMIERFSINVAKNKNTSFKYFAETLDL